jgi:electron transfer flavoprotein alpha subunit
MEEKNDYRDVWVFADHRDYFRNRVTLELIAKGNKLAEKRNAELGVVLFGYETHEYIMEYTAHGADVIYVVDNPKLRHYKSEAYVRLLSDMAAHYKPEILLIGGTDFGRELAARVAKRLETGLSADCLDLDIDESSGNLVQTSPAFGGNLYAVVVTPTRRPQMATVRPGTFRELTHNPNANARVIYPNLDDGDGSDDKIHLRSVEKESQAFSSLEDATVVICGGRGMGSREGFESLRQLAAQLEGEIGATRPAIIDGWSDEACLIGQTGKNIRPKLLITCGTSGAIQYTAGITQSESVIAINKDPNATIFRMADIGIVGDARRLVPMVIRALERRNGLKEVSNG